MVSKAVVGSSILSPCVFIFKMVYRCSSMVEQQIVILKAEGSSPFIHHNLCLAELVDAVDLKSISLVSIGSSPIAVKVSIEHKRGVIGNISVCQAVSCRFESGR